MNSVFHSPGTNPFHLPPIPQAHYLPSPANGGLDRSITLTPQKPKHRHEYSYPPEVYTPEQYSIWEETSSSKPPLPCDTEQIPLDLQKYFNEVDSWTSEQFCEQWPSKEVSVQPNSQNLEPNEGSKMSSRRRPLSSTQRSKEIQSKEIPVKLKTSFADDGNASRMDSQRASDIAIRLNRFRYGEPKPPHVRRKERIKLPVPSSPRVPTSLPSEQKLKPSSRPNSATSTEIAKRNLNKSFSPRKAKELQKLTFPQSIPSSRPAHPAVKKTDSATKSPPALDDTISTLNSRLEDLLRESSLVVSSPEPQSSRLSTATPSLDSKVSSLGSDDLRKELSIPKLSENLSRRQADWTSVKHNSPARKHWSTENVPPKVDSPSRKLHLEDDILYQWRLRRKLETAREDVAKNRVPVYSSPRKPKEKITAERPFTSPSRAPHNITLHPSPKICGTFQAQTTQVYPSDPHSSCTCLAEPWRNGPQIYPGVNNQMGNEGEITPPEMSAPKSGYRITYSPRRQTKSVGVSAVPMKSSETQTSRSLILSDEDTASSGGSKEIKSGSDTSRPYTSTPASSVSFHKVKIVRVDVDSSPGTSKGSPKVGEVSPASTKTNATTTWSSTDDRVVTKTREEKGRSPESSMKTCDQHFERDSEICSPTGNVVRQIIGSRLFNSSQTPISTSRIARLQEKKKRKNGGSESEASDQLSSSYTTTLLVPEPSIKEQHCESLSGGSENAATEDKDLSDLPQARPQQDINKIPEQPELSSADLDSTNEKQPSRNADFDPSEMIDKLLEDVEKDPGDFPEDPVLQTLRNQRDEFVAQFREIERQIENCSEQQSEEECGS